MSTSAFQVLIFDFDYTLFDTSAGVVECMRHSFTALGYDVPSERAIRETIGLPLPRAILSLCSTLDDSEVAAVERQFLRAADDCMVELTVPIPPVLDLLPALKGGGFHLALFTGKYRDRVERTLERHRLRELFSYLVCGDEVPGKPNPEGLSRIFARWPHLAPHDFVLIGDHYLDIVSARNAGIACVSVNTGRTPRSVLESYSPLAVVPDLTELARILPFGSHTPSRFVNS